MITLIEMGKQAKAAEQQLSQLATVKKNQVLKPWLNKFVKPP